MAIPQRCQIFFVLSLPEFYPNKFGGLKRLVGSIHVSSNFGSNDGSSEFALTGGIECFRFPCRKYIGLSGICDTLDVYSFVRGRVLIIASMCVITVVVSAYDSLFLPTALCKHLFTDPTSRSHTPPIHGEDGGLKIHLILSEAL